jgi:beta-glucosidase
MSSAAVRELARDAVRKSLVLLKNDGGILPLRRSGKILVVGKGADSVPMQSGGWSLTWQGDNTTTADYPNADTLLSALRKALGTERVDYRADGAGDVSGYSAIVMVAAEKPYAEGAGDIKFPATLRHTARYPQDLEALSRVSDKGVPVVTVLYSGRTVAATDLMNRSDAFIAAWLPGTEAAGITDLLLSGAAGQPAFDFVGRLPFDWPAGECLSQQGSVQFPRGYGLSFARSAKIGRVPEAPPAMACPAESR